MPRVGYHHTPETRAKQSTATKRQWANPTRRAQIIASMYGRLDPQLAPTEYPTTHDLSWAAGIYEGEGHCGPPVSSKHTSQQVQVTQKDTWILLRLRALFGGCVRLDASIACSRWYANGARARGFLMSIYGLLSPRRQEQIRRVLDTHPLKPLAELTTAQLHLHRAAVNR